MGPTKGKQSEIEALCPPPIPNTSLQQRQAPWRLICRHRRVPLRGCIRKGGGGLKGGLGGFGWDPPSSMYWNGRTPQEHPPPPPPLPMFEADSQGFASAPSVPRGFELQNLRSPFAGDHRGTPWGPPVPPPPPLTCPGTGRSHNTCGQDRRPARRGLRRRDAPGAGLQGAGGPGGGVLRLRRPRARCRGVGGRAAAARCVRGRGAGAVGRVQDEAGPGRGAGDGPAQVRAALQHDLKGRGNGRSGPSLGTPCRAPPTSGPLPRPPPKPPPKPPPP